MNKPSWAIKYISAIIAISMIICLVIIFHVDTMEAAENTTDINYPTNHKVTKKYPITTKATKKINTTNDGKNTKIVSNSNLKSQQNGVQFPKQNTKLKYNNKDIEFKNPVIKGALKDTPKVILGKNVQPPSKTIKVQSHSPITQKKKLAKQPIIQNKNKAIMPTNKNQKTNASIKQKQSGSSKTKVRVAQHTSSKRTSKSIKPQLLSSSTKTTKNQTNTTKINKNIKPQTLSSTTKKQQTKPLAKQAKASKSVKVIPKTSKQTSKNSNYYNQAPKTWSSKIPGSDNVRDFGQTTEASGINDALKIMKKSGNKGVTLEHTTAKSANIATVFNWNPIKKALTYGTGTAIGKHTILTANHVVNNPEAHKPMSPSSLQNLRVNLLQEGSTYTRSLNVIGVKMMQFGDVALLYTKEDISKYMKIRKIAPEKSITNIKANTPIHMYHYGLPTGKFKNDPMGTMYHSKGKYSLMARNINPMGYYQMMAEPGSSGGAILNSKNEVLGIHAFRIDSGDYKKYHLNTMAELRSKLRKEVIQNII
ncbi:trypsin-like peptidase domain-containing protein [Staphylococcus cohnii species complex 1658]|uniref:trypsin-like peptidase domain-containing protein n=1 Tax=Staphylococcus cohnii species complex 1658 TaxID=3239424 RepID=UPI00085CAA1C|nr:serine protease [Staphylococcus cohnii]RIL84840.1 serine protease [Staphylococcus cohnii]SCS92705.1 serine protease SplE [Staphylococcus cohnii subsp. cohnii]